MNGSGLPMWREHENWDDAEAEWERVAADARGERKLRGLRSLPNMVGVTADTAHRLKWKSFWYMVRHDHTGAIRRGVLRHPLRYAWRYLRSLFFRDSYRRDGDFFLYGVESVDVFADALQDAEALFVLGFSYCHKPFECPSGRFTDACIHDRANPVCRQCFIGKCMHARPRGATLPLIIPTVHYIGEKIFEVVHRHPGRRVLFLITACELTLKMFGDWGNMAGIQGIGVRLDGRICNTMRAFELSERGVKPGLTVVLPETQREILDLLRRRDCACATAVASP